MFQGSIVALVTPMHPDGRIDYLALGELVDWHVQIKTDGLVVLGTTGESPTIESDEREEIIKQVVKQVKGRLPVIAGTGANSTHHAILLTQQAMELGVDAVLLVTPYYNKPTQEGLYQHFKTIAQTVPVPQILYNVPSRTACDLLPETVGRLAQCSNIVGLKEATGKQERLQDLLSLKVNLDLLSGDDATALEFMLKGGKGVISVVANVVPQGIHQLCAAALSQDVPRARELNNNFSLLYKELFVESNPIPVKWLMEKMGLIADGIRLPLTRLTEKFHQQVLVAAQQAGINF